MKKYIYVEVVKGKQIRQGFATKAEAIGFGNIHFEANLDVEKAYIIEAEDDDPDLSHWVDGVEVKVYK